MNRSFLILSATATSLLIVFCFVRFVTQPRPSVILSEPAGSTSVEPARPSPARFDELHPYVESLRTAQAQGTASQLRNEMRRLVEYCHEQPARFSEVLKDLSQDGSHNSETMRIFGEVLVKGHGQPADELIKQTAYAWSKQIADPVQQRLGFELLAELGAGTVKPSRKQ